MSYLPSSRLYERELEPQPEAPPADAAPKPAPPAPSSRRATMMPKEWLVAPAPVLHVEVAAPTSEPPVKTVTVPAAALPASSAEEPAGRKRNIFHKAHKVVLRHLDRAKNKTPDPAEPDLLWFAVMATGSLCMGLMIWGAYSALPRFGRAPLRADALPHRLKASNDVPGHWVRETGPNHSQPYAPPLAPPMAPPVQAMPVSAPPPPHEPPFLDRRLPEVEHSVPVQVETPLAPLPERKDPAIFVPATRGETPMIRTWNELTKTSFLLAALAAAPANNLLAGGPEKLQVDYTKPIADLTKEVKDLRELIDKKINDVNEKITKIPKNDNSTEFDNLNTRLGKLEKMIEQMARNPGAAPGAPVAANVNLEDIKAKLGSIEQAILKLQPTEKQLALFPPSSDLAVAKSSTSHVIFVNLYSQDLWLWVNQKQHRVPAGTVRTLDSIPAGPTTIEIRSPEGVFHRANPTLVANETFTLTAR